MNNMNQTRITLFNPLRSRNYFGRRLSGLFNPSNSRTHSLRYLTLPLNATPYILSEVASMGIRPIESQVRPFKTHRSRTSHPLPRSLFFACPRHTSNKRSYSNETPLAPGATLEISREGHFLRRRSQKCSKTSRFTLSTVVLDRAVKTGPRREILLVGQNDGSQDPGLWTLASPLGGHHV